MGKKITTFSDIFRNIPRNGNDYNGGLVLFATESNMFYFIEFGTGDNLDHEDRKNGYDDMVIMSTETFNKYEDNQECKYFSIKVKKCIDNSKIIPIKQIIDISEVKTKNIFEIEIERIPTIEGRRPS